MFRRMAFLLVIIIAGMLLTACSGQDSEPDANLPNPASVYCEEHDGTLEFRQDTAGGTIGICVFEDGSECEEWAFYRDECAPGDSLKENTSDN